jgi:hypothetical protein
VAAVVVAVLAVVVAVVVAVAVVEVAVALLTCVGHRNMFVSSFFSLCVISSFLRFSDPTYNATEHTT